MNALFLIITVTVIDVIFGEQEVDYYPQTFNFSIHKTIDSFLQFIFRERIDFFRHAKIVLKIPFDKLTVIDFSEYAFVKLCLLSSTLFTVLAFFGSNNNVVNCIQQSF